MENAHRESGILHKEFNKIMQQIAEAQDPKMRKELAAKLEEVTQKIKKIALPNI